MQQQSNTTSEITKALVKLQAELSPVKRQSQNPFLNKRYADLTACWEAARDPLSKNGLAVVQTTEPGEDGSLIVVTTLSHTSGEWFRGYLPIKPVKSDPQALGSAITYGRRYSFAAIIGLAPEDDDAEGSMARQQGQPKRQAQGKAQNQSQSKPQQQPPQTPPAQGKAKPKEQKPAQETTQGQDLASTAQQQKLNILLKQTLGNDDRNLKIDAVNTWLKGTDSKKTISTSKQLSKKECSQLIEQLQRELDDQAQAQAQRQKNQGATVQMDNFPF